jgi:hypothetical protein
MLDPSHAPTPFTADEIRRGSPIGKTIALRVEPEREAAHTRINRFVSCDEKGATIERRRVPNDGEAHDPGETRQATWLDLQAHASFPAEQTTIEPEALETPMGTLACLRYTVREGTTVHTFWFANELPGMPVKSTTVRQGRVISTVTMVRNSAAKA